MTIQSHNIGQFVEKWTNAFQCDSFKFVEAEMGNDCAALGFVLDGGHNAEEKYPGIMGDHNQLQEIIDSVSAPALLGSAIYSKWRFYQHWACSPWDTRWFLIALKRLGQLSSFENRFSPYDLTGETTFTGAGENITLKLKDFWKWSASNLLDNTMRGMLAEFLVAKALHAKEEIRQEWQAWDLTMQDGIRVEVKSSSYLQNWTQTNYSSIRFGIQPTRAWNPKTGTFDKESKRQSDFYVFCLLKNKDQSTLNPMAVNQWDFYIFPTEKVDRMFGNQRTIGLSTLLNVGAKNYSWEDLQKWGEDNDHTLR